MMLTASTQILCHDSNYCVSDTPYYICTTPALLRNILISAGAGVCATQASSKDNP
jgi:hypothetical protein